MPFLDKKKRTIVYTDLKDEVLGVRESEVIAMPKMTGVQYEKKVKDFLSNHLNHLVIHRLRKNLPLTPTDLQQLEQTLIEIGEEEGKTLLTHLLEQHHAPSLPWFVRTMVGMDRSAAQAAFARYLNERRLTTPQIRFIEMVIDQLTSRGVMTAAALYEPPFSNLHAGGPDELFHGQENVIEGIFDQLKQIETVLMAQTG